MSLGQWPGIGIASAREKYSQALQELQNGIDPGRKAQEAKAALKSAPTFSDLLDEHWEMELKKKKSGLQTKKLLESNVIPAWGKWKVADIKRRHIVILLDKIAERAPIGRNRVHGALSRIFNFAAERGVIDDSPCTRIKKLPEKGRDRVLTDDEIKALWDALDLGNKDIDLYKPTKLALKLILLTGQRPAEVCGMQWAEIDGETWTIPAERRKTADENRIPLLPMAKAVIDEARAFSADCQHVFRSSYKPEKPMTRHALTRSVDRHWSEMGIEEKFTPHDLRRTLRTRLAELKVDDVVAEKILGHRLQGVLGIYNRYDYAKEKRQALARWEIRLAEILGQTDGHSNKVIDLAARRGA
ncbi:site-specific integrase [Desulfosarcina cetonica]